jgi:hypothetical protein
VTRATEHFSLSILRAGQKASRKANNSRRYVKKKGKEPPGDLTQQREVQSVLTVSCQAIPPFINAYIFKFIAE